MTQPPARNQVSLPIEDYAIIGDCVTAALVGRNGSIDWLCWPRFDSGACLAALVGDEDHGRFLIAPTAPVTGTATRKYRDGNLVLETLFETPEGSVVLIDFMVPGADHSCVVRIVEGRRGRVDMRLALSLRFDYGIAVPWVTQRPGGNGIVAIVGPEMVSLRTPVALLGEGMQTVARFTVAEGERVPFVLTHSPSQNPCPPSLDPEDALAITEAHWAKWAGRCKYDGPWAGPLRRSLLTLKALTYAPTGGIVAAPTTSLPEKLGGNRNWDYRYCWLRDATITLSAFLNAGYTEEASSWAEWLRRSIAGSPDQVQIAYGIGGERRLPEWSADWLPGYEGAGPVRIGNAAVTQVQLDVYGEVMDALHRARRANLVLPSDPWSLQCALLRHLEKVWDQPDEGLWETRGGSQQFTFSKVMAWVAFDRCIKDAEQFGLEGPVGQWRALRDRIHERVCQDGFDPSQSSFTQVFGAAALDASLLLIPTVGFLPYDDPRVLGTIAAVERVLLRDGYVLRYQSDDGADGLPAGEGAFLACSFWLAIAWHKTGRRVDAKALLERLLALQNDVGLLSEEYDPVAKRMTGNFPQAFSHVALVNAITVIGAVD